MFLVLSLLNVLAAFVGIGALVAWICVAGAILRERGRRVVLLPLGSGAVLSLATVLGPAWAEGALATVGGVAWAFHLKSALAPFGAAGLADMLPTAGLLVWAFVLWSVHAGAVLAFGYGLVARERLDRSEEQAVGRRLTPVLSAWIACIVFQLVVAGANRVLLENANYWVVTVEEHS